MRYQVNLLAALAVLVLQACAPVTPEPDFTHTGSCTAPELQDLVGQNYALSNMGALPQPLRLIGPGMAVTMDFSPSRLNIEYDARDIITRVWCG